MNNQITNVDLAQYLKDHPWLILVLIWVIIWKGLALWQSARKGQKVWFVALLIVNTLGLLEIVYVLMNRYQSRHKPLNPLAPDHFSEPKNPNLP